MKPCSRNRKRLVWLALGALAPTDAPALRQHLANCEGCRGYWEEISAVTEHMAAARPNSTLEASETFHRRVAERLTAAETSSALRELLTWIRCVMGGPRLVLPAMAALLIAAIVLAAVHRAPPVAPAVPLAAVLPVPGAEADPAPTLANYNAVASESLEKLDELLTRQGSQRLPPSPVLTAWSLETTERPF